MFTRIANFFRALFRRLFPTPAAVLKVKGLATTPTKVGSRKWYRRPHAWTPVPVRRHPNKGYRPLPRVIYMGRNNKAGYNRMMAQLRAAMGSTNS